MARVASDARRPTSLSPLPPAGSKARRTIFTLLFVGMFAIGAGFGIAHPLLGARTVPNTVPTAGSISAPAPAVAAHTAIPGAQTPVPAAAGSAATPDAAMDRYNLMINEQNYCDCNGDTPR